MTRQKHRRKKRNLAISTIQSLRLWEHKIMDRREVEEIKELIHYLRNLYAK